METMEDIQKKLISEAFEGQRDKAMLVYLGQKAHVCAKISNADLSTIMPLLQVVTSMLDQLYHQKLKESNQLLKHTKEKTVINWENLSAEEELVFAELKNLLREMEILCDENRKITVELIAHLGFVGGKLGQLRGHGKEEVTTNGQLQKHTKLVCNICSCMRGLLFWGSKRHSRVNNVTTKDLSAEVEEMEREMDMVFAKQKVWTELQGHLHVGFRKIDQEHIKILAYFFSKDVVVEVSIKKWESEGVNKDTVVGLKKIGGAEELWNMKEDRVATLKEAISYLFMMLRVGRDTELTPHAAT